MIEMYDLFGIKTVLLMIPDIIYFICHIKN
jgi:hypothetical protein